MHGPHGATCSVSGESLGGERNRERERDIEREREKERD